MGVRALVLRSRERAKLLGRLKMAVGKPSWWKESSLNCGSSDQAGTVTHQGLLPSRSPASQPARLLTFTPGRMLRKGIADFPSLSPLGCLGDPFPQWRDTSRDTGELEFMTPVSQSLDFRPPFFAPVKCRVLTLFMRCVSGTSRQGLGSQVGCCPCMTNELGIQSRQVTCLRAHSASPSFTPVVIKSRLRGVGAQGGEAGVVGPPAR